MNYPPTNSTAQDVVKDVDLSGKYFLITGANTGIGFETGRALALRNAHVVLACRNTASASDAKDRIFQEKSDSKVFVMKLDCSDLSSVENCAKEYIRRSWPLHGLILNAGVVSPLHRVTDAGFEATFQINHLAHFYLTTLLEEKLIQSAPSRVVSVSSEAYKMVKVNPEKLTWEMLSPTHKNKLNSAFTAYGISKFCNVLFAKELNKRLGPKGVTAFSLHPGVVKTEIARNSGLMTFFTKLASPFMKTPVKGAATSVYCAMGSGLETEGGKYFDKCRPRTLTSYATDERNATKLWEISEEMIDHYKQTINIT